MHDPRQPQPQPDADIGRQHQMLALLEDFLLLADPDTIHQLDKHLHSTGSTLRAEDLIGELGRLVTKAHEANRD